MKPWMSPLLRSPEIAMTAAPFTRARRRRQERGAVLLTVIVITVVLTALVAAALVASSSELGASRNTSSGDMLLACAEAGRTHLLSMFRTVGENPRALSAKLDLPGVPATGTTPCPDGSPPVSGVCARTGHIGQNSVNVVGVRALPAGYGATRRSARDISNVVASPNALGEGTPYQVVVHCQDDRGREAEVEFVMRFGV